MLYALFTNDQNVTIQLPYHPFSLDMGRRNEHEVMFRRLITFLIKKGIVKQNIIDSGCWVGDNAVPWAKTNPSSTVYAIDPSQQNMEFIQMVCEMNDIKNITLFMTALSNTIEILSTDENLHHCTLTKTEEGKNKTHAVPLDMMMERGLLNDIGFIHLDVEGMEANVIAGASQLIATYKPVIAFEQHLESDDYKGLSNILIADGYQVYLIEEVMQGCRTDCRNFIAFPSWVPEVDKLLFEIHTSIKENLLTKLSH